MNEIKLVESTIFKIFIRFVSIGILGCAFFGAAGRIDWTVGWCYILFSTLCHTGGAIYVHFKNPEVLRRRGRIGKETKNWDKICLSFFGFFILAILIVAALDAGRYQWFPLNIAWSWPMGAILYLIFIVVVTWSMAVNPHFEKTVRIQHDRGHKVIDSGPYRFVRHPGYMATILGFVFAIPLLLGSGCAFVPAILSAITLIIRTSLEDRTLLTELPGYKEFSTRTPYRLFPYVW